jgi:transcriptional regulator with GAF, ATPase, and Fis domain
LAGSLTTIELGSEVTEAWRATPASAPYLLVFTPHGHQAVPLSAPGSVLIGRGAGADVRVEDGAVSREHARVHAGAAAPHVTIEDLSSRNGTFLRGARLAPGARAPVAVGDTISVGAATLVLRLGRPPVVRPAAAGGARVVRAPEMVKLHQELARVAASSISVLVLGETGVGKEVVAETLHELSGRSGPSFVRLNCAALPGDLLESELFGSERGAYTGAVATRAGLLEAAEGGTLFLDEVGDLPLPLQGKLLRVLESGEFFRLGSSRARRANVRFVAATNRDLKQATAGGRFRPDLYYRLNGVSVLVPPLRARPTEILPLAEAFAARIERGPGVPPATFTPAARERLERYAWPGNARELKSVVERSVLMSAGGPLDAADLLFDALGGAGVAAPPTPPPLVPEALPADDGEAGERAHILAALEACAFNQTKAAEALGMPRRTLVYKLRRYGLPRPRK